MRGRAQTLTTANCSYIPEFRQLGDDSRTISAWKLRIRYLDSEIFAPEETRARAERGKKSRRTEIRAKDEAVLRNLETRRKLRNLT